MNNVVLQRFLNSYLDDYKIIEDGIVGANTLKAKELAEKKLSSFILAKTNGSVYTGLYAVRTKQEFDNQTTDFLLWLNKNTIDCIVTCSTRAGNFYVYNPITYGGITGTAVLAEGYYPDTWLGSWQTRFGFKSFELLQVKPVTVYRDGNKNKKIDKTSPQTGLFGINIHTAGWSNIVDRWSAGCIVVPKKEWDAFASKYLQVGKHYSLILEEKNN